MMTYWTSEEIFLDGDKYFDCLIEDLDNAQNYITIEMYIFNDDSLGRKITDHLIQARKRGVKIQVIVDGIGSYAFFDNLHRIMIQNDIMVKMYNPLPFYHPYYGKLSFLRKLQVMGLRILRINQRNHRKIITIDNNIMYLGSYNITAEHTKMHVESAWQDMGVRVTGEQVRFSVLNFKKVWKLRDYFRFKRTLKNAQFPNWRDAPVRLNQTLLMKRYFYKNFLQRINQAEKRIWLMTPYFIPKRRLIRLLGRAAKRGVDVRILISLRTDVPIFRTLQYFYFSYLIKKGAKVYQYTNTVLHAKNYMIDSWITIGSTNLNHRSFLHDLEVDIIVQGEKNMSMIEGHFLEAIESGQSIDLDKLSNLPLWDRILSRLFFLFKYWF